MAQEAQCPSLFEQSWLVGHPFGSVRTIPGTNLIRYQARYTHQGQRYNGPIRFTTKRVAATFLAKTQTEISKGTWQAPGSKNRRRIPNLRPVRRGRARRAQVKADHQGHYARWLRNVLPVLDRMTIPEITAPVVRTWHAAELAKNTPTQTPHNYQLLAAILATAVEDEIIVKTPCRIKGAGKVRRAKERHTVSKEEILLLAETVPPRYRALILLTALCALRSGDVTALTRADLDMTNCQVRIRRSQLAGVRARVRTA